MNLQWIVMAVLLFTNVAAHAEEWRTFAGGFTSRWKTIGHHGHDQPPCATPDCDSIDFSRSNLDNSIGFRAGRERDFWRVGPLHIVGGGEASVSYTEYNLSQRDFALVSGSLSAGADVEIRGLRLGARIGAGPFATSNRRELGMLAYREVSATLPLRPRAGLRISARDVDSLTNEVGSPAARETSLMLVASPHSAGASPWEFAASTGTTRPGLGFGSDRNLRSTAFTRVSAYRDLTRRDLKLELSWTSTAHESSRPSVFRGYDMNFRSKTIDGLGLGLSHTRKLGERFALRASGGVEVADWRDEHQLLTRDEKELVAGVEVAPTAALALRFKVAQHLALETSLQKIYWSRLDLGEARWAFGIVITQ